MGCRRCVLLIDRRLRGRHNRGKGVAITRSALADTVPKLSVHRGPFSPFYLPNIVGAQQVPCLVEGSR
ncbi:hypothetical protein FHU39_002177 [Flexivirga oryzae]|uniref:Uncharacterized protein n=1 Tax=Flexivirga oryzae TaxID=1794944 RepID=A0A839N7R6_9MICO|nr:hypothetical protein [Flexivirga oryzae]